MTKNLNLKSNQLFYYLFFILKSIKWESLKLYIKLNITNKFIHLFKFLNGSPILIFQRKKSNLDFYFIIKVLKMK